MIPSTHTFRHEAMATHWVIHLLDEDSDNARAAAREAFALVDRLESRLSRFRDDSDLAAIRWLDPGRVLHIDEATYACIELGLAVYHETNGAFDPTVTPLYDTKRCPAEAKMGMSLFLLNESTRSVEVKESPVCLDLGGLGKGYALDQMTPLLEEREIAGALLVSGDSTMLAWGRTPEEEGWTVGMQIAGKSGYLLKNEAMSTSGFESQGYHIYDPRSPGSGPARGRPKTWAFAPSAALADAVSTALIVMSDEEITDFCKRHPEIGVMTA